MSSSLTPQAASASLSSEKAIVRISPLFEALLNSANGLLKVKQPSAAVLIAQTAIEICTERLIHKLLDKRGAMFLDKWIDGRLQNYKIANEIVRQLYQAVSSDADLVKQAFWTSNRLKTHVELRNDIAHEGRFATELEAQASLDVAREVIQYLSALAAAQSVDLDG